jgi:hypothetical protein
LNTGFRNKPPRVVAVKSTSASSTGSTQVAFGFKRRLALADVWVEPFAQIIKATN